MSTRFTPGQGQAPDGWAPSGAWMGRRLPAAGWGSRGGQATYEGGYPLAPQTGQAPMPWPASTRWATAICCDSEAPAADEAYWPPP